MFETKSYLINDDLELNKTKSLPSRFHVTLEIFSKETLLNEVVQT